MRWKTKDRGVHSGWAIGVLAAFLLSSFAQGLLVHCTAADGHAAIESVFHAAEARACIDRSVADHHEHDASDHHPHDCDDVPLDDEVALLRAGGDVDTLANGAPAPPLPRVADRSLRTRRPLSLCPGAAPLPYRSPPRDGCIDSLATVILLI